MHRLSSIVLFVCGLTAAYSQSPHGDSMKIDCASCHDPGGWTSTIEPMLFDHDSTNFALIGVHTNVDCNLCHSSMVFSDAPSDCIACHTDIHSQSVGNDCTRCHSPENWLVDHIPELHEENGFPLIASHSGLNCIDCHQSENNMRFDRLGNDCISCHEADFLSTQSPDHIESGFSTNCIDCHDPQGFDWSTDLVDHGFFPLSFGHEPPSCNECHLTDNFSDASPECVSCHLDDFESTMNPDHGDSGFSTNCAACHSIVDWVPATFDHDNTDFPLMGGHIGVDCLACHADGYAGTPTDCVACHLEDYNNTNNPDHESAQFPTVCAECHTETGWEPASFDHDVIFPIYSGAHENEWDQCIDCHIDPNDYSVFSCTVCHGQSDTADEHDPDEVPDYVWESNACLECHPDGSE